MEATAVNSEHLLCARPAWAPGMQQWQDRQGLVHGHHHANGDSKSRSLALSAPALCSRLHPAVPTQGTPGSIQTPFWLPQLGEVGNATGIVGGSQECSYRPYNRKTSRTKGGFPGGSDGKESASNGDPDSIPGSGRSPREGKGYLLQYSCLEKSMDRGTWQAALHRVVSVGHDRAPNTNYRTMRNDLAWRMMGPQWRTPALHSVLV